MRDCAADTPAIRFSRLFSSTKKANSQHDMSPFKANKLAELRRADGIVDGRWVLVIREVVDAHPYTKSMTAELESTLDV